MKSGLVQNRNTGLVYLFSNIKSHWYLFAISLPVFLGLAYAYNKLAEKEYWISSSMLLQSQNSGPQTGAAMNTFAAELGMFPLSESSDNIKNEAVILQSRKLMKQVVQDLHLNVRLYSGSGIRAREIYQESPFNAIVSDISVDSIRARTFQVDIVNNGTWHISSEDEEVDRDVAFGVPVKLGQYSLTLKKRPEAVLPPEGIYSIEVVSEEDAVNNLLGNYSVEFPDKSVTTISMGLIYPHPEKGEVILQHIMTKYLENSMEEKIRTADSMLVFINDRLNIVAGELSGIEEQLEEYRSSHSITNIDEQSRMLIGNAADYYKKLNEQQTQLAIIGELESYLKDSGGKKVIPGSLSLQNSSFSASLTRYNELLLEREKKSLSYTDTNPVIVNLDQQIESVRKNLLQNIASYKNEMELSREALGAQNSIFNNQIRQIPGKERVFLDYARQQDLKQQLYMYLLQRWEEAAIAKNSNTVGSKIIDNAKSSKGPVSPPTNMIYFMAFIMGLIVPLGYINSKDLLHSRIKSELDIEKYTDISIIGKIGRNTTSSALVVDKSSNSLIAESFRSLRTNLQFVLNFNKSNVIMVTSSVNGEGKTFLSWNLGSALALAGKKVVFMELDLRKPKLSGLMGLNHEENGYSDYVAGGLDKSSIVKPCPFNENCYIVSSGPVTSNPSELLLDHKLGELIDWLRSEFDYVVIDSPPVGLVSDALIIERYTDLTMYVCRHNYTNKSQIELVNELKRKTRIQNLYLVVNDINLVRAGYVGYGNSYV